MSKIYVLSGAYNDCDNDGVYVIAVSDRLDVVKKKLLEIIESKGAEYLKETFGELTEEIQEMYYEIRDCDGSWANFFITENELCGEPKTNGDRFRRMSNEDLAFAMMCPYDCFGSDGDVMPCAEDGVQQMVDEKTCHKCMMNWLEKEV